MQVLIYSEYLHFGNFTDMIRIWQTAFENLRGQSLATLPLNPF